MTWLSENWVWLLCVGIVVSCLCLSQILICCCRRSKLTFLNRHVFITGGSQGLGRALAIALVAKGAKVSIVARRLDKLHETVAAQQSSSATHGQIAAFSADVTDLNSIQNAVAEAEELHGPIDILIPCAGSAKTGYFIDKTIAEFDSSMNLNYMGAVRTIHAVLPSMIERKQGAICFITSALALTSYVGYSAYSPTKYALRGLADTLRNELLPHGISVHIAYPGNMDTPGFEVEQSTKPEECKEIETGTGLDTPEKIASKILTSLQNGNYAIYCGSLDIAVLGVLANGLSPRVNTVLDMISLPFLVIVAMFVRGSWDKEVCKRKYSRNGMKTNNTFA